jgi:integrase/recombinase XerD
MAGQARVLSEQQIKAVLSYLDRTRMPRRNKLMFLLSIRSGLRAKEISDLTWDMVDDGESGIADAIQLSHAASKGRSGRAIPIHKSIAPLLAELKARITTYNVNEPVIISERGGKLSANVISQWFGRLFTDLGMSGCSSHSGRRTFVTKAAHLAVRAGGSLREVQELVGHKHLGTTQRYIETNAKSKRRIVDMM